MIKHYYITNHSYKDVHDAFIDKYTTCVLNDMQIKRIVDEFDNQNMVSDLQKVDSRRECVLSRLQ